RIVERRRGRRRVEGLQVGDTHLGNETEVRGQRPQPGGEFEAVETVEAVGDEREVRMPVEGLRRSRTGPEVGGQSGGDEHAHEGFLSVVVGAERTEAGSPASAWEQSRDRMLSSESNLSMASTTSSSTVSSIRGRVDSVAGRMAFEFTKRPRPIELAPSVASSGLRPKSRARMWAADPPVSSGSTGLPRRASIGSRSMKTLSRPV